MNDMDECRHRWADSPSDAGEGIYCTRCGDMAHVSDLRDRIAELEEQVKRFGVSEAAFEPYRQRNRELQAEVAEWREKYNNEHADRVAAEAKLRTVWKLPHYLCEFPDIGKVGAAVRLRDLQTLLEKEARDE